MPSRVTVKSHKRGRRKPARGKARTVVKGYCRRPPNRTIRWGSKRYNDLPF